MGSQYNVNSAVFLKIVVGFHVPVTRSVNCSTPAFASHASLFDTLRIFETQIPTSK